MWCCGYIPECGLCSEINAPSSLFHLIFFPWFHFQQQFPSKLRSYRHQIGLYLPPSLSYDHRIRRNAATLDRLPSNPTSNRDQRTALLFTLWQCDKCDLTKMDLDVYPPFGNRFHCQCRRTMKPVLERDFVLYIKCWGCEGYSWPTMRRCSHCKYPWDGTEAEAWREIMKGKDGVRWSREPRRILTLWKFLSHQASHGI